MNSDIKAFLQEYQIKVVDEIRIPVYPNLRPNYGFGENHDAVTAESLRTETALVCQIPLKSLEFLQYKDRRFLQFTGESGSRLLDRMMRQQFVEESIRKKNPAVKEIWEQYQLMLQLADETGELRISD